MKTQDLSADFMPISVAKLLSACTKDLKIEVVTGLKGVKNIIKIPRVQKAGLVLSDQLDSKVRDDRVQIFGKTEITFLNCLDKDKRRSTIEKFCSFNPCCIFVTRKLKPPKELIENCESRSIPLFRTDISTGGSMEAISRVLRYEMAPTTSLHGVLMEIFGLGVLIIGDPAIGKSESALDLVTRGHRFVADDMIRIKRFENNILIGSSSELIKNLMEIRGLGIINIRDLFGMGAVRDTKRIELIISLAPWEQGYNYDRLGLSDEFLEILSTKIPLYKIPVAPGRNLAVIIETAARNFLVKINYGKTILEFEKKMNRKLMSKKGEVSNEEI